MMMIYIFLPFTVTNISQVSLQSLILVKKAHKFEQIALPKRIIFAALY